MSTNRAVVFGFLTLTMFGAVGCSVAPSETALHDPFEDQNRAVHSFNKGLDEVLLRPASQITSAVPAEITDRVSDFSDNLSLPGMVVNGALQGDLEGASKNTLRFVVNTTLGLLGLFDPATDMGLSEETTDFGETLHVWGFAEGAYVELPVLGPSTERDAVGSVVDLVFDPLQYFDAPEVAQLSTPAFVLDQIITRGRYSDTVDSILYESADSYAQARLLYLENRRFQLGMPPISSTDDGCEGDIDPFLDPFADPFAATEFADCDDMSELTK